MVFSYLVWPKPRWLMWQQTWLREAACWVDGLLHSIIRWVCVRVIDSPSRYAFSTHACVFFKVLLLFRITWLVRKCLPVCVFVFFLFPVGRFPSCTEKTDLSIYNIQISSRREKKNAAAEKLKKKNICLIWNWVCSSVCTLQTTFSLQTDILTELPTCLRDIWEEWYMSFAVGMNLFCGRLVNHDFSWVNEAFPLLSRSATIFHHYYFQAHYVCAHEKKTHLVLAATVLPSIAAAVYYDHYHFGFSENTGIAGGENVKWITVKENMNTSCPTPEDILKGVCWWSVTDNENPHISTFQSVCRERRKVP